MDHWRVAGSIPALATISNSMNRNGFRVSPADYPGPSMADPRTIGKWVGGEARRGVGGELASWEPGKLAGRAAGPGRLRNCLPLRRRARGAAVGGGAWGRPWGGAGVSPGAAGE